MSDLNSGYLGVGPSTKGIHDLVRIRGVPPPQNPTPGTVVRELVDDCYAFLGSGLSFVVSGGRAKRLCADVLEFEPL